MRQETQILAKRRYRAHIARSNTDLAAAQALRARAFGMAVPDCDPFDAKCTHLLVHEVTSGTLVCCFRMLDLPDGGGIRQSYSAQFYDLSALAEFPGRMVEIGRFCIHPNWADPDILRIAWGAITAYVDENNVEMLFGCSSFAGTDTSPYQDAFALLKARHLAPDRWAPGVATAKIYAYAARLRRKVDVRKAMQQMPQLLRSYLLMGGWVSDHAVLDRQLNTLHVFTGLEISAIPAARKRLLRAVAAGLSSDLRPEINNGR